jgi:centromere protein J
MMMQNEMKFFLQQKEIEKDNFEKYKQSEIKKLVDEKNKITKETETLNELKKKYQEENLKTGKDYIKNNNKINNDKELIEIYKNKLNKANDEIVKLKNILNNININIEDKKYSKKTSENKIEDIEHNKSLDDQDDESEDNDDDSYNLILPDVYHKEKYNLIKTEKNSEGTTINTYDKNKIEINLINGDRKEIYDDKYEIIYYNNGDIKQVFKTNNKQVFYFKKQNITKTTLNKGLQIIKYNDINQLEKIFPDGTKKISFDDGSLKYILPNGTQETYFPDGRVERISKNSNINL